jgi:hypothetical protein
MTQAPTTVSQQSGAAFDKGKADAFGGTLLTALNHASLCVMTSVGHRTGLFDLMSTLPPASSTEIAARAGLNERYVREWLAALTAARVLEFDATTQCFSLPAEHAAHLTRAAGADNMAVFSQYVAVLGGVEDDIVECFRRGGGVPCSRFTRFHDVMAEDSSLSVLSSLESHILPLAPGLMGRLARGIRVLDAGCGPWTHPDPARDTLPPQSIRGNGPISRGHRPRAVGGRACRLEQREVRGGGSH